MKASELIRLLQEAEKECGDLTVIVRDRSIGDSYTIIGVCPDPPTPMEADDGEPGSIDILAS